MTRSINGAPSSKSVTINGPPIGSTTGSFDQELNTTDDVRFNSVTSTKTSFEDNEFVTKQYVDTATTMSDSLVNTTAASMLSPLTGHMEGVENILFHGKEVSFKSAIAMTAGRVVAFDLGNDDAVIRVKTVDSSVSEAMASTQAVGITLHDTLANESVRVAVSGICSVLVGIAGTFMRGSMLVVPGTDGTVASVPRAKNQVSIGICLSTGARNVNQAVVCFIRPSFESY